MTKIETDDHARTLWTYLQMNERLEQADAIIAMGSMDMRVAERAAELWQQKLAPLIVVTGGTGRLTSKNTNTSEASQFANILHEKGIPESAILIEDKAGNGAENFTFSINALYARGISARAVIAVTQPYMERRAYATGKKLFPSLDIQMASPTIAYGNYPTVDVPRELMINIIVGELIRVEIYPAKGFTIPQEIPANVKEAASALIEHGYATQLPR